MKTELILLYTCLSLAFLALLAQFINFFFKQKNSSSSAHELDIHIKWSSLLKLEHWITIEHESGKRWEGFYQGQNSKVLKLQNSDSAIIYVPSTVLNRSVINIQEIPHIRPVRILLNPMEENRRQQLHSLVTAHHLALETPAPEIINQGQLELICWCHQDDFINLNNELNPLTHQLFSTNSLN
jgi:hypothetical protein